MTVLLRQQRTYQQIFYDDEAQFSLIVKNELGRLLPGFSILRFSPYVLGDEGRRRRPDMALVHRDYQMWVVVEVELEKHSLVHHVLPQVYTFVTGEYNASHAATLYGQDPTLDLQKLVNLTTYVQPVVVVVVNSRAVLEDGWGILESDHSARLMFVESFRAEDDDVVVAVSGYLPSPPASRVIGLKKHKMLNALFCAEPTSVPAEIADNICLLWHDRVYRWDVLRTKDTVVFLAPGGFTVRGDRNYEVLRGVDEVFRLNEL